MRQLLGGVAVVLGVLVLSGCQETITVGVVNDCGRAVEAEIATSTSDTDLQWTGLEPGEKDTVRPLSDGESAAVMMVRRPGAEKTLDTAVDIGELDEPADAADYDDEVDVEVVLSGKRCPR